MLAKTLQKADVCLDFFWLVLPVYGVHVACQKVSTTLWCPGLFGMWFSSFNILMFS